MTNFYPYQWDLNCANPVVFNDMTENLLYLTNRGIDVIRLDAVPYIWKELGTTCRNLPQVHTLVRMMRMVCEIVCPSVLLLGEVVMEPAKVVPYFGTPEKPECHMLYNVTTMATTWNSLATGDVSLLRHQMDTVCALPRDFLFLNYLRCHDDIGWGLDYPWLGARFGTQEVPHKKYLNDWFTGKWPGSDSRGELYNDDPTLGDARLCGTTASLCGVEAADFEQAPLKMERAISCDLMLHAWMLVQSGIPVLYSGDEIGQLNDYTYHDDPERPTTAATSTGATSSGTWPPCAATKPPARANSSRVCAGWKPSALRKKPLTPRPMCGPLTPAATMYWAWAAGTRATNSSPSSTSARNLYMFPPGRKAPTRN